MTRSKPLNYQCADVVAIDRRFNDSRATPRGFDGHFGVQLKAISHGTIIMLRESFLSLLGYQVKKANWICKTGTQSPLFRDQGFYLLKFIL